jgi:predicted lipoprotein with Yx(FWY)xxD motif
LVELLRRQLEAGRNPDKAESSWTAAKITSAAPDVQPQELNMRNLVKLSLPALAASLLLAACGSSSPGKTTSSASAGVKPVAQTGGSSASMVKTASNPTLGTLLVNAAGMTLYHLSGEQNGKFICTSTACLAVWHPLPASSSAAPSAGGIGSLGTVKRADGTIQVTYKGAPLYTFAHDTQPGETNGQGIKDVGTWSAATTSSSAAAPAAASASETSAGSESSGGGGYAY